MEFKFNVNLVSVAGEMTEYSNGMKAFIFFYLQCHSH